MLDGFDKTWGIAKESGESSVSFPCCLVGFIMYLTLCLFFLFFFFSSIGPSWNNWWVGELLKKVWEIPLEQQKWKDLVTLDTLHAFCRGPELTPIAWRLHASSRRCKSHCLSITLLYLSIHFLTHPVTFSRDGYRQVERVDKEVSYGT